MSTRNSQHGGQHWPLQHGKLNTLDSETLFLYFFADDEVAHSPARIANNNKVTAIVMGMAMELLWQR